MECSWRIAKRKLLKSWRRSHGGQFEGKFLDIFSWDIYFGDIKLLSNFHFIEGLVYVFFLPKVSSPLFYLTDVFNFEEKIFVLFRVHLNVACDFFILFLNP